MSKSTNNGRESVNQSQTPPKSNALDARKANDIEATILHDLEFSVRFARLAYEHSDIFDHQGFVFSLEKYLDHARNVSSKLKELRKVRGVTD
jgi:hypothetical protein